MMDINYFLFSKKNLQKILSHLNEIKLSYFKIKLERTDGFNDEYINDQIKEYENKIIELELTIKHLTYFICDNCQHTFVEDVIDIAPDISENITYCTICEYTK